MLKHIRSCLPVRTDVIDLQLSVDVVCFYLFLVLFTRNELLAGNDCVIDYYFNSGDFALCLFTSVNYSRKLL